MNKKGKVRFEKNSLSPMKGAVVRHNVGINIYRQHRSGSTPFHTIPDSVHSQWTLANSGIHNTVTQCGELGGRW